MSPGDLQTIVRTIDSQLRGDARWHSLPAEGKLWLVETLAGGTGYRQVNAEVQARWGVKFAGSTLSELHTLIERLAHELAEARETREALIARLTTAGRTADEVEQLAGGALVGLTRGTAAALGEQTLHLLAQRNVDAQALAPLLKGFVAAVAESRKHDELRLEREKFEELRRKAALAEETEAVAKSDLTPADQMLRIRELFGLLPAALEAGPAPKAVQIVGTGDTAPPSSP